METLGIYSATALKTRLSEWNIASKKRWGQNFLIDRQISTKIVNTIYDIALQQNEALAEINAIRTIWEIGPGLGALTAIMAERCRLAQPQTKLRLFEIDHGIIKMLSHYLLQHDSQNLVAISAGDAEKTILKEVQNLAPLELPQIICGNLPYSSGVRLLIACSKIVAQYRDIIAEKTGANSTSAITGASGEEVLAMQNIPMCVMLQKEGAERLVAGIGCKQYGVSSVLLQSMYNISILYAVPATCFYPVPNVESVICSLIPRKDVPPLSLSQLKRLQQIVHASFSQRRKTIRNTLGNFLYSTGLPEYEPYCHKHNINLGDRAENISPEQYTALAIELDGLR